MAKEIRIEVDTKDVLDIDALKAFQGNLKKLSDRNYERLKKLIVDLGFSDPFNIWENEGKFYILDGHQRLATLLRMRDEGFTIPELPIVYVQAKDFKQARKKVLAFTSQFGEMSAESLQDFIDESDIDMEELDNYRFPEVDLEDIADNILDKEEEIDPAEGEVDDEKQFIVAVYCASEPEMQGLFEEFEKRGLKCKLIT